MSYLYPCTLITLSGEWPCLILQNMSLIIVKTTWHRSHHLLRNSMCSTAGWCLHIVLSPPSIPELCILQNWNSDPSSNASPTWHPPSYFVSVSRATLETTCVESDREMKQVCEKCLLKFVKAHNIISKNELSHLVLQKSAEFKGL
jgi:hypothetical protein